MSGGDEGFLSRWSRLKREPVPAPEPATPAAEPAAPAPPEGKALDDLLAQLPNIEDLVPGQSLSAFMQPWVPTPLRNAALQRMWLLDPAIRDYVSPALDYAYDYNTPGGAPGFGTMETGQDAIREVAEMFDRAMGATSPTEEPVARADGHDNVSHSPADGVGEHAAVQQALPAREAPAEDNAADLAGSLPKSRQAAVESAGPRIAAHNKASETNDLRPVGRRHGGALPG